MQIHQKLPKKVRLKSCRELLKVGKLHHLRVGWKLQLQSHQKNLKSHRKSEKRAATIGEMKKLHHCWKSWKHCVKLDRWRKQRLQLLLS